MMGFEKKMTDSQLRLHKTVLSNFEEDWEEIAYAVTAHPSTLVELSKKNIHSVDEGLVANPTTPKGVILALSREGWCSTITHPNLPTYRVEAMLDGATFQRILEVLGSGKTLSKAALEGLSNPNRYGDAISKIACRRLDLMDNPYIDWEV